MSPHRKCYLNGSFGCKNVILKYFFHKSSESLFSCGVIRKGKMTIYQLAIVQMDSGPDRTANLARLESLIAASAEEGANLVALPETVNAIVSGSFSQVAEPIPGFSIEALAKLARRHGIWLHCGSIVEQNPGGLPWNTSVLLNPEGNIVATYRKLHLFDVNIDNGPRVRESDNFSSGHEISSIQTPLGKFGFTICYDLRFPELFRSLALSGAEVIFVPANFTQNTGRRHWETLLRARAIENACYIIAPAQCGSKPQYQAHGHSLAIGPDGEILASLANDEGVALTLIDLEKVREARRQIPVLANRRSDLFGSVNDSCF